MKIRNNWNIEQKQYDKVMIKLRLLHIDFFTIEIDLSRKFYLLTILNFTIKNR